MRQGIAVIVFLLFKVGNVFPQGSQLKYSDYTKKAWQRFELLSGKLLNTHQTVFPILHTQSLNDLQDAIGSNIHQSWETEYLSKEHGDYFRYTYPDSFRVSTEMKSNRKLKIFRHFYTDAAHAFSMYRENGYLTIDPLLDLQIGKENTNPQILFTNRRGLEIQGGIDRKVFFYSNIVETQISSPEYVNQYIALYQTHPGAGFLKKYKSSVFNITNGYDFLLAEGAIQFRATKHVHFQLGHGRHFIGSGERSLFLSDFAAPAFYARINTTFWKIHYQNLYMELSPESQIENTAKLLTHKKYMTSHYLSVNLTKKWNIGVFESVVFARNNGFELQYLNPIILYRFVEQALGSPDNAFLGLHSNLILFNKLKLYGQLLMDEFVLKELIIDNKGWWANKYGFQLGAATADIFGIKGLDLRVEWNKVRPYTYSYRDSLANYAHFQQTLAHPLGSNFNEILTHVDWQISGNWKVQVRGFIFQKGIDSMDLNLGGNILKPHTSRPGDYGHKTGQGVHWEVFQLSLRTSYRLWHNACLEMELGTRNEQEPTKKSSLWVKAGFRMNLNALHFDF